MGLFLTPSAPNAAGDVQGQLVFLSTEVYRPMAQGLEKMEEEIQWDMAPAPNEQNKPVW